MFYIDAMLNADVDTNANTNAQNGSEPILDVSIDAMLNCDIDVDVHSNADVKCELILSAFHRHNAKQRAGRLIKRAKRR